MSTSTPPPFHSRPRHRKRFSVSHLSSDTTATLPEYTSSERGTSISDLQPIQFSQHDAKNDDDELGQPPEYPDSADEADEETDDLDVLPPLSSPLISPRRRQRFYRNASALRPPRHFYANPAAQSDTYLDSLLARSVHALELSNALLQSSMSTQTSLSTVLDSHESPIEKRLDSKAKALSARIRINEGKQERWMGDLDVLARDVEACCGESSNVSDRGAEGIGVSSTAHSWSSSIGSRKARPTYKGSVSRSLPSSGFAMPTRQRSWLDSRRRSHSNSAPDTHGSQFSTESNHGNGGRLQYDSPEKLKLQSPPPRAMTQYVNVESDMGDRLETTSDISSIYLPSTLGLRSNPHLTDFTPNSNPGLVASPPTSVTSTTSTYSNPTSSPAYASLTHAASASSPSSRSSRISRSPTPTYRQLKQQRSRSHSRSSLTSSRSCSATSDSLHQHSRLLPPAIAPIEELPSQSDSSTSDDNSQPFRTVESLRKILDEQPVMPPSSFTSSDTKGKGPSHSVVRTPVFNPRSPPVEPVTGTSSLTTSISRLYTKGSHSTSTRAPSPPRHSSLKQRPTAITTSLSGGSTLSIPDLGTPGSSRTSSGRSTPRNVVFGPLPESYASSKPPGTPSKFQEQKEAKARRSSRKRSGTSASKGGKHKSDKEESSWWTTWLTGGSTLSMSAARNEEKSEDRMARSWGRPAMGVGFDEWPV